VSHFKIAEDISMSHFHAVVWIDHQKATVWQFSPSEQQSAVVHAQQHQRLHSRKSTHGGHQASSDRQFFEDVALALAGAHEILRIGPAHTKQEFAGYLRDQQVPLGHAVVAVENADHPTDAQVLAYARRHFTAIDRLLCN
jgi:hypothetical protein